MRVLQYYNWGYFEPITCGADVIASNQLEYFHRRGWDVDVLLQAKADRAHQATAFHRRYPWVRSVHLVDGDSHEFSFRGQLFVHERMARSDVFQDLARQRHDLFLTNYAFTAPLASALPGGCKKILEALDIVTESFALYERTRNPRPSFLAQAGDSFHWKLELELYRLFDRVLFINEQESRLAARNCPAKATAVPPMLPSEHEQAGDRADDSARAPIAEDSFDLIFVGSNAPANIDGIDFFYRRIFVPFLREHQVRLAIVGNVCDGLRFQDWYVTKLGNVHGDLRDLYQRSKVVIIPVFEGTGLSIKTIECLANGRAVAASAVGARGLRHDPEAFLLLDMMNDPKGAAEAILGLLRSEPSRLRMQRNALEYYRANFGSARYFAAMDQVIESLRLAPARALSETAETARSGLSFPAPGERQPSSPHKTPTQGRSR